MGDCRLLFGALALLSAVLSVEGKTVETDRDAVFDFFSNYTNYLSDSIGQIPKEDLRAEISKLFQEVKPTLYKTVSMRKSSGRTEKLRKILKELRNIESLLGIVTRSSAKTDGSNVPEKAPRRDVSSNKSDTFYYNGLSRFQQSLLSKPSGKEEETNDVIPNNSEDNERRKTVSEDDVLSRVQEVLKGRSPDEREAVRPVELLTLHKEFHSSNATKVVPPWDPRVAVGKPTTRVPYKVRFINNRYRQSNVLLAPFYFINQCVTSCFTPSGVLHTIHHSYSPPKSAQLEQDRLGGILCRQPPKYLVQRTTGEE